jgi:pentose-5-phosphate-3-epimerase
MDGNYVRMLTVGPPFIKARTTMLKDVHLMVREPLASVGDAWPPARTGHHHPDSCVHPHRVLQAARRTATTGPAIARRCAEPGTPVDVL